MTRNAPDGCADIRHGTGRTASGTGRGARRAGQRAGRTGTNATGGEFAANVDGTGRTAAPLPEIGPDGTRHRPDVRPGDEIGSPDTPDGCAARSDADGCADIRHTGVKRVKTSCADRAFAAFLSSNALQSMPLIREAQTVAAQRREVYHRGLTERNGRGELVPNLHKLKRPPCNGRGKCATISAFSEVRNGK